MTREEQLKVLVGIHIDTLVDRAISLINAGIQISSCSIDAIKRVLLAFATAYDQQVDQFELDSIDQTKTMRVIDRLTLLALMQLNDNDQIADIIITSPKEFKENLEQLPSIYEIEEEERSEDEFEELMKGITLTP